MIWNGEKIGHIAFLHHAPPPPAWYHAGVGVMVHLSVQLFEMDQKAKGGPPPLPLRKNYATPNSIWPSP